MVAKLGLPFPLLSDPDGSGAIRPYDVWNAEASLAQPAVVVVRPDGEVAFRQVGGDYAERATEEDVLAAVTALGLGPTVQEPPSPGDPQPGPRAYDLDKLPVYFRGAKFAVTAVRGRVPAAAGTADELLAEYDRYLEAVQRRRESA